jgi:hypothetical protein
MNIDKIKLKYKYLIINNETNEINLVKSTRLLSELIEKKYKITISHMFFYRYFDGKKMYFIKENLIIKKLNW